MNLQKNCRIIFETADFIHAFFSGSIADWLKNKFRLLDPFYWKVFLFLFLIGNVVFFIHTSNYLFGNHDFNYLFHGVQPGATFWSGRYTNNLPIQLLGGNLTPVLNNFLAIAALAVSAMLICGFYGLPKKKLFWLSAGLLPMLLPYVMTWFFYVYETFSHALLPGLAVSALWLAREKFDWERMLVSSGLVWFALGIYPSVLATFGILAGGLLVLDLAREWKAKDFIARYIRIAAVMLIGGVAFKVTVLILKHLGKLSPGLYSLSMPTPHELMLNIVPEFLLSFKQFFHATPYIPVALKLLVLAIILLGITVTAIRLFREPVRYQAIRALLVLAVWGGMFFCTMLPDFLSKVPFAFVIRVGYFGLPFLGMTGLIFVFRFGRAWMVNGAWLLTLLTLWCSAVSDLEIQKNWKLGFQNEMLAYSRVLTMLEQHPQVSALKMPINYFQVGCLPSERRPFCRPQIKDGRDSDELHSFEFNPDWKPRAGIAFQHLSRHFKIDNNGSFRVDLKLIAQHMNLQSPEFLAFLRQAKAYPAPPEQCLYVDKSTNSVVVVLNADVLEKLKAALLTGK